MSDSPKYINEDTPISLLVINKTDAFFRLKDDWQSLSERCHNTSIFMDWEWQYSWWINYGKEKKLRLIIAYQNKKVVGVLPLYIGTLEIFRWIKVSALKFVGVGGDTSPDYLEPLVEDTLRQKILNKFSDFIVDNKSKWNIAYLTDIPDESDFKTSIYKVCQKKNVSYEFSKIENISYIKLPKTWEEYLSSVSANRRSQIRRSRKRFYTSVKGRFFVWKDESELSNAFDILARLHRMRWTGKAKQYAFSSDEYLAFHKQLVLSLFKKNQLRLYCLEADGKLVAMLYCYRWKGTISYFQGGIDNAYNNLRPGQVLMCHAIENAIEEGEVLFDMLKGEYSYKKSLAKYQRKTICFRLYSSSYRALLYKIRIKYLPQIKQLLVNKVLKNIETRNSDKTLRQAH